MQTLLLLHLVQLEQLFMKYAKFWEEKTVPVCGIFHIQAWRYWRYWSFFTKIWISPGYRVYWWYSNTNQTTKQECPWLFFLQDELSNHLWSYLHLEIWTFGHFTWIRLRPIIIFRKPGIFFLTLRYGGVWTLHNKWIIYF